MKISVDYEITGCVDCPYLRTGRTYGNDGRDGWTVYICSKGVFGGTGDWGDFGLDRKPKIAPYGCPYLNATAIERVASKINITTKEFEKILKDEHCEVKEI